MLFDLRARGRRRTIQVIYLTLAILMGGGLVLFGIGGEVSGGLLDGLGVTNTGSPQGGFEDAEEDAEERIAANPRDAAAWAELARARYQVAASGDNYDQNTGQFNEGGREKLAEAGQAWERYLALETGEPDDNVATLFVQAYGPAGLNQPARAMRAAQIVATARPSANTFTQLATFAYAAEETRIGDLAAQRAIALTDEAERPQVRDLLAQIKQRGSQAFSVAAPAQAPAP